MSATVNGREVAFANLSVIIAGTSSPLHGLREISFETERPAEYHKGAGDRNVSWSRGGKSFSGSVTLLQSDVLRIQKGSGVSSLTDLDPFDLIVSASFDEVNIQTTVLQGCIITKDPRSLKSEDLLMEVKLDLTIGDIKNR